jgi:hypothetical protein
MQKLCPNKKQDCELGTERERERERERLPGKLTSNGTKKPDWIFRGSHCGFVDHVFPSLARPEAVANYEINFRLPAAVDMIAHASELGERICKEQRTRSGSKHFCSKAKRK